MRDAFLRSRGISSRNHIRRRRKRFPRIAFLLILLGFGVLVRSGMPDVGTAPVQVAPLAPTPVGAAPPRVAYSGLLDPAYGLGVASRMGQGLPVGAAFQVAAAASAADEPGMVTGSLQNAAIVERPGAQIAPGFPRMVEGAPLPAPRPRDLIALIQPQQEPSRPARQQVTRQAKAVAAAPESADSRSIFEKLFGARPSSGGTALAYAPAQGDATDAGRGRLLDAAPTPAPRVAGGTAIYDISARTVYMPNGERLEAHSGLGDKLDDPRFVHVRMHGATPPHTYDLTEREALFHGVRAIRLNPVGGSGNIHGRAGLLAHTYMLGPNGDSNGCISFRDYNTFLQAFLRGEVKRLVVVAGNGSNLIAGRGGRSLSARNEARAGGA